MLNEGGFGQERENFDDRKGVRERRVWSSVERLLVERESWVRGLIKRGNVFRARNPLVEPFLVC